MCNTNIATIGSSSAPRSPQCPSSAVLGVRTGPESGSGGRFVVHLPAPGAAAGVHRQGHSREGRHPQRAQASASNPQTRFSRSHYFTGPCTGGLVTSGGVITRRVLPRFSAFLSRQGSIPSARFGKRPSANGPRNRYRQMRSSASRSPLGIKGLAYRLSSSTCATRPPLGRSTSSSATSESRGIVVPASGGLKHTAHAGYGAPC